MDIYVDVLIVTNIYITYIFIKAATLISHTKYPIHRVLTASLIGGMSSLQILITGNLLLSFAIKLLTLFLIAFVLAGFKYKEILNLTAKLTVINLMFIGIVMLIWRVFGRAVYMIGVTVYFDISMLMLVAVTAITYLMFWIYDLLSFRLASRNGGEVTVVTDQKRVCLSGVSDTGNTLYDFFAEKPVVVCSSDELEAEYQNKRYKLLAYTTVNGKGLIRVYTPKEVFIDQKRVDVNIGLLEDSATRAVYNPCILR